ncbi:MAG: PAS domain-containing protein [Pseudomonadales bacterium]|nr:PAS domain-containing protein [Pseudomonadales bacterium]
MNSQQALALTAGENTEQYNLELAFRSFSEVSAQLADSYEHLQTHVSELQRELAETNKEKLRAARDKENLSARLEHLLKLLPGGVVVVDSFGIVEQCNPAAIEFLGDGLLGQRWAEVIGSRFSPRMDDGHEISLKDGRRLSIAIRSMDDGLLPEEKGQIILLTDQTQTRQLQDQLARRDRLSTMGKMVAYLAHQIRTPLSSAMLYGGHLRNPELDEGHRLDFSEKLLRQLRNLELQISDLLIFARGDVATQTSITVAELFHRINQEIELDASFESLSVSYRNLAERQALNCNPQSLISAILNLVNNAHEASQEFCQASNNGPANPVEIVISSVVQNAHLIICIADNGPGICDADRDRVLEPFFSTKAKGTGLGLAVVQAVAKSIGANLSLSENYGGGLKVKLSLPLV